MSNELQGKTALVTGAASGIGAACAIALAEGGADAVLADMADASAIAASVEKHGVRALVTRCDISDEDSVANLFAEMDAFAGGVDIVINSAGILLEKSLIDMTAADFDRTIAVNLRGTFLIGKHALPIMQKRKDGRFIAVTSELAQPGRADFSAYVASKAGVIGLVKSWAREFAPNVMVNALAPGPTDTPMLGHDSMSDDAIAEDADNPMGRVGQPDEIAAVARFLAGPGVSFMTGQTISPNGGAVMV